MTLLCVQIHEDYILLHYSHYSHFYCFLDSLFMNKVCNLKVYNLYVKLQSRPTVCLNSVWKENLILKNAALFQVQFHCNFKIMTVTVKLAQLYLTLGDPMNYTAYGILQARILEWVAMPFSRGSSQPKDWTQISHIAGRFFYLLSHQGSPRILEWVAYPFSSKHEHLIKVMNGLRVLPRLFLVA